MSEAEPSDSAQRTANASWQLAVSAFGFGLLSRLLLGDSALLVIFALIVAVALGAGAVCAIRGIWSFVRHGGALVLVASIVGAILNAILIYMFVAGFIEGYNKSRAARLAGKSPVPVLPDYPTVEARKKPDTSQPPVTTHLGTWVSRNSNGEMTCVFTPTEFSFVGPKGTNEGLPYEIDYSMNPIWLTLHGEKYEKGSMLLMLEFTGTNQMRVMGSNTSSNASPVDFGTGRSELLVFERRLME